MSDIDDGDSQEIETCTSSNTTTNSKKLHFIKSILTCDQNESTQNRGKQNIDPGDRDSRLSPDKREYIRNWILTHHGITTSPQKLHPASLILATIHCNSPAKRSAKAESSYCKRKRASDDIDTKENSGVSLNRQSWPARYSTSSAPTKMNIENEKPLDQSAAEFMNISNDSDKTCVNSPGFNENTITSTFNARGPTCKVFADGVKNCRRSAFRRSSTLSGTISSSSPLQRIESPKAYDSINNQLGDRKQNGRRTDGSNELPWLSTGKSTVKIKERQSLKRNDHRSVDHDYYSKSSPSLRSGGIENATAGNERTVKNLEILSREHSWIGAQNRPTILESGTPSSNNSNQNLVRQSSNLIETLSIVSPLGDNDRIEVESSITNPDDEEIRIESDSDDTGSIAIEKVAQQDHGSTLTNKNVCKIDDATPVFIQRRSERPRDDALCDSDETYYSNGDSALRLELSSLSSLNHSQKISQYKSDTTSREASPFGNNWEQTVYAAPLNKSNGNNQKKKKAKKGTLLARLQNLVSLQVSGLRIWRHQMSQPEFKRSVTHFVAFRVRERQSRWGRNYITASLIADRDSLLTNVFPVQGDSTGRSNVSGEVQTITLMIVPEVTGAMKIRVNSFLHVYPPWEIIDRERKILTVTHFDIIEATNSADPVNADPSKPINIRTIERVIKRFECRCIHAKAIVDSCSEKFTEKKPSVMRSLFDS